MSRRKRSYNKPQRINTLLDIVLCVYGRFDLLDKCLKAIPDAANGITYSITLVDNNSPDKEEADNFYRSISDNTQKIHIIRNKTNIGFPKACNQGAKKGTAPLIFQLNTDVILEPDSINKMVMALDDPEIGVVGMKLVFPDDALDLRQNPHVRPAGKVQHVGLATNIRGDFFHIFLGWSPDHPKVNNVRETYAVTGAALMTRRSLWRKVNGFNEQYGLGTWEDVEYCIAVRQLGYNIIVETKALGTHYTNASAEKYGIPYPLDINRMMFMSRWSGKLSYTEINHW